MLLYGKYFYTRLIYQGRVSLNFERIVKVLRQTTVKQSITLTWGKTNKRSIKWSIKESIFRNSMMINKCKMWERSVIKGS